MRLHRLEITAFGPFADTVEVDFDALSDAGLFLLTGPTGAGKTSILDAVCFALYGDVPGDRAGAKRLRSDHASPGTAPRVSLECTLSGRRLRLVRSPAWLRPKKRGVGTTPQQASVTATERVGDAWVPLSSRLDETGQLVTSLLGMNLSQFTQVVMLPQGGFQAFLRARSEDRHRLLQQLFRTGRFEGVERWLRERRREVAGRSRERQQEVCDLVSRLSEAADTPPPAEWAETDLALAAAEGAVTAWSAERAEAARVVAVETADGLERAVAEARAAEQALNTGRDLAERRQRLARARAEHARLQARGRELDQSRQRLADARRAAGLPPLHQALEEATGLLARTRRRAEQRLADLDAHTGTRPDDPAALGAAREEARRAAATVAAALPQGRRLAALRDELAQARAALETTRATASHVQASLAAAPAELSRLRSDLSAATAAEAALPQARERVERARARWEAAQAVPLLTDELAQAEDRLRAATDRVQSLRERWLDLQERRITGMAAELAGRMTVGECCPVCGSAEHPQPARPSPDAPDAAAERRARRLLDDAEAERHLVDGLVRDATTRLALVEQAAGTDPDAAEAEVVDGEAALQVVAERAATLAARAAALRAAETAADEHRTHGARLVREAASLEARVRAGEQEAAAIAARVQQLLLGSGCADLAALLARHETTVRTYAEAEEALRQAEAAARAEADASQRLTRAAREAGFADVTQALSAVLPGGEEARLEAELGGHDAAVAAQELLLADPRLVAAEEAAAPDLGLLERADLAARDELSRALAAHTLRQTRADRLSSLDSELQAALRAWAPVREELALVTGLSQLVEGRSADNRLQMRLSAYVLAYRLRQVVAAANERLAGMSDCRYSLEHSARRGAGETRGGLSLTVRDDWSGESRDPATLSGGETFVVSLALALGLADVVTQETGGAALDTLFVDEGFGALDADTLEDVMDTLDSLRDGGRVVGVVSHVPEMADRIPTQLAVVKSPRGSTLRVRDTHP